MRITEIKPLNEERVPLMVRMIERALSKESNIPIDLTVTSGRKHGFLTRVEPGRGWSNADGTKTPTYRFTYERYANGGRGTFEIKTHDVDKTMTFEKEQGEVRIVNVPEGLSEMYVEGDLPIWFNIIRKYLDKKPPVPVYFASGGNRITDIYAQKAAGKMTINLRLSHVSKKENGRPKEQMYTIWEKDRLTDKPGYEKWKLEKFNDGVRLTMVKDLKEGVEDPSIINIMNRRLEKKGAVKVNLDVLPIGRKLVGWITEPIEKTPALKGWQYGAVVHKPSGGRTVIYFGEDADTAYTLSTKKDGNGNKYIEVSSREAK